MPAEEADAGLGSGMDRGVTEEHALVFRPIIQVTNMISIVSCLVMLTIFFTYVRRRQPAHYKRTSLRILMAITVADAVTSAVNVFVSTIVEPAPACQTAVATYIFGSLSSTFFSVSFAHNLHQVMSGSRKGLKLRTPTYLVASILLAGTIAILPGVVPPDGPIYGWSESQQVCWFRDTPADGNATTFRWLIASYFAWQLVSLLYMSGVFVALVLALQRARRWSAADARRQDEGPGVSGGTPSGSSNNGAAVAPATSADGHVVPQHQQRSHRLPVSGLHGRATHPVRQVARRAMLFLTVPIATHLVNVLLEVDAYASGGAPRAFLLITMFVVLGLQGFFNAVIFCFDTALAPLMCGPWRRLGRGLREARTNMNMSGGGRMPSETDEHGAPRTPSSLGARQFGRVHTSGRTDNSAGGYMTPTPPVSSGCGSWPGAVPPSHLVVPVQTASEFALKPVGTSAEVAPSMAADAERGTVRSWLAWNSTSQAPAASTSSSRRAAPNRPRTVDQYMSPGLFDDGLMP